MKKNVSLEEELASKLIPHIANRIREALLGEVVPAMLANGRRPGRQPSDSPKKRYLSPAARRRISEAQHARWAKIHEEKEKEAKRITGSAKYEAQRAAVLKKKGKR